MKTKLLIAAVASLGVGAILAISASTSLNEGRDRAAFTISDYVTTQTETGNDLARGTLESCMFQFPSSAERTCTVSFVRGGLTGKIWSATGTADTFRYECEGGGVYILTTDQLIFAVTEATPSTGQVQYVILRD